MSRFDLINVETNSKVKKLILLGFLLDLAPINNPYEHLLKSSKNFKTNNNINSDNNILFNKIITHISTSIII